MLLLFFCVISAGPAAGQATHPIRLNQIGFYPSSVKTAIVDVSDWVAGLYLVRLESAAAAVSCPLMVVR
jgi:hypothetical protein